MWLFLNHSYLSVVQHRDKPDVLLVRSRIEGDIQRVIPEADVFEDPQADYRYRAWVSRDQVKQAMAREVDRIDYPNFKASVIEVGRHRAYMDVWSAMVEHFGAYGRRGNEQ